MTLLFRLSALACIACHVHAYPLNFAAAFVVAGLAVAITLIWQDERKPHPATSWSEPVRWLPIAELRKPACMRRK